MSIAGLLVHAHPLHTDEARAALCAIPGVEIHGDGADGRLILTLESDGDEPMAEALARIPLAEGVLSAALVYSCRDEETESPHPLQE